MRQPAMHTVWRLALVLALFHVLAPGTAVAEQDDQEDIEEIEEIEEIEAVEEIEEIEGLEPHPVKNHFNDRMQAIPDRIVNLHTGRTTRAQTLLFVFDHRTNQPWTEEPLRDLFGFDGGGLKIGLGARYGVTDWLDIGYYRLNATVEVFDTHELDLKAQLLRQADHGVDMAARGGMSIFDQDGADTATGYFGQLLASRTFAGMVLVSVGALFHSESSNDGKSNLDHAYSAAASLGFEIRPLDWLGWNIEGAMPVAGFGSAYPVLTSAVKFITFGHTFSLVLSNNQYTAADGVVAGSERDFGELIVGFTIAREIRL